MRACCTHLVEESVMNQECEFCDYALQPVSGVGEAMHAAGIDGSLVTNAESHDVVADDEEARY